MPVKDTTKVETSNFCVLILIVNLFGFKPVFKHRGKYWLFFLNLVHCKLPGTDSTVGGDF